MKRLYTYALIMTSKTANLQPLQIKDCALLEIATGVSAQNIQELTESLSLIHPDSITYHFFGTKLRACFESPEYQNDFATWAYNNLHDNRLAERLSLINPRRYSSTEDLRNKLIEIVDLSIDENKSSSRSKESEKFQFIRSETVLFDMNITVSKPEELVDVIGELPLGSIYYHFIDSTNNIGSWLTQFGDDYKDLSQEIMNIDPYFYTLDELRTKASQVFCDYFKGASN